MSDVPETPLSDEQGPRTVTLAAPAIIAQTTGRPGETIRQTYEDEVVRPRGVGERIGRMTNRRRGE